MEIAHGLARSFGASSRRNHQSMKRLQAAVTTIALVLKRLIEMRGFTYFVIPCRCLQEPELHISY